ncbi:MAG: TonB-dependent receptor [Candidatus Eisenbacteria bacterium]|nr:TonB-dependent receptor [Candidatus Eisenbacteria bacterium]
MKDRLGRAGTRARAAAGAVFVFLLLAGAALAGTTGKLAGRVVDRQKKPLAGVNVAIPAYRLGAPTDADGKFVLLNIPPGKCEVRFRLMGYRPFTVRDVEISADNTTRQDAVLEDTTLMMQEIVVEARRPVVELRATSNVANVSREMIRSMPVQEIQDVVNLQAGVVDGHFRGGRSGEVQYQVDGVSVNNPYDNTNSLKLDRSLLEEVQVISGTFDAEYGQAMSGVVNAVLTRGGDRLKANFETYGGGFVYSGGDRRRTDFTLRPSAIQGYQASLSGPTGLPETYFVVSARRGVFDDYVYGYRLFRPTDRNDFERLIFRPTGDTARVPLAWSREWSGVVKLTNRSIRNVEVSYQAIFNHLDAQRAEYKFFLLPEAQKTQRTRSVVHGLEWTHTLGSRTVYKLSVRQNYFDYRDMAYDDIYDPRYDAAGVLKGDDNYQQGPVLQGVDFGRFTQRTDARVFKGSFTSQLSKEHQVKFGAEFQLPKIVFGSPGGYLRYLTENGVEQLKRKVNEPPDFPPVREYRPVQGAAYAQEELEWNDLTVHAGVRAEYFDARSTIPSDLENPADSISGVPHSHPQATTVKLTVAPRLGVSYPVSERAALFFAYGHFYQMPGLGNVFDNADYSILARLQAGDPGQFGVFGNPDIRPEKTVQYQVGYKQAVSDRFGVDVNLFYKDIRDLLGVEFVKTYTQAEYARFTNVDFGKVLGTTLTLNLRQKGLFSGSLDYTWQMAQGNSSDPRETLNRVLNKEDRQPRQVPLDWDQRHTLNLTATMSRPGQFAVTGILRVASGQPYTPTTSVNFGGGLGTNSGIKPAGMTLDLRMERQVRMGGLAGSAFAKVLNVFDTRYFNGAVFPTSGSPYYSRYPSADVVALNDPLRLYQPRRIEVGVSLGTR